MEAQETIQTETPVVLHWTVNTDDELNHVNKQAEEVGDKTEFYGPQQSSSYPGEYLQDILIHTTVRKCFTQYGYGAKDLNENYFGGDDWEATEARLSQIYNEVML